MSRSSFASQMRSIAREKARAQREYERAIAREQKENARAYSESRLEEAASDTAAIKDREQQIETLLERAYVLNRPYDFSASKMPIDNVSFEGTVAKMVPPSAENYLVPEPSMLAKIMPGWRYRFEKRKEKAQQDYAAAVSLHQQDVERREAAKTRFYAHQAKLNNEALDHNRSVDVLNNDLISGSHDAIITFSSHHLNASFEEEFDAISVEVGYSESSRHLVLDLELPTLDAVPEEAGFKYIKNADRIDTIIRPISKRKALYANLISQICLKCISCAYNLLSQAPINNITLNGMLDGINPATGHYERVCLISVSVTPDVFLSLNLAHVQAEQCLKVLKASVSRAPAEMSPVKPLVELDMVDPRFIASSDVMSSIDHRANLMDLSPGEFEGLITNLFSSMGLDTRQTRASRDGGVDCVAFDQRPIFGGKVVIQAKRYKGTVGVSAVRDLFGTVQNEGASKGILVTTSGYGKASYEFAKGKPLELLDGGNLLHLLQEHAQIDAKIVMPDDWRDSYMHTD